MQVDQALERWITGKDGESYLLRPIRPSDAGSLIRGYDALSDEGKRFRLLSARMHLTEEIAREFCSPDPERVVCLVVEGKGALAGEIIAGARVAGVAPGAWADFAVIDADSVEQWLYHLRPNACVRTVARGREIWKT